MNWKKVYMRKLVILSESVGVHNIKKNINMQQNMCKNNIIPRVIKSRILNALIQLNGKKLTKYVRKSLINQI